MKIEAKCPHCESEDTYIVSNEHSTMFSDDQYQSHIGEYGNISLVLCTNDCVLHEWKCHKCEKHFFTLATLDIAVKKMVTSIDKSKFYRMLNKDFEEM